MAVITQKPDALTLSGNLKKFILSSGSVISFVLKDGATTLLDASYEPGADGKVTIDVRDIIEARLGYLVKADNFYQQTALVKTFTAVIDGAETTFRAIRAGVANLSDTPANWLAGNFLTWQPVNKQVTYYSPEWITYYATVASTLKLKAYFDDAPEQIITLGTMVATRAYTANLQYATIAGLLGNKYPKYFEVYVENSSNARLTYIQRYLYSNPKSEQEQWFLFENSLGGLDTLRAGGDTDFEGAHEHKISHQGDLASEYDIDTNRSYDKNTGYLTDYERRWLLDFFPARAKYIYASGALRSVVITESDARYTASNLPSSFNFTYQFSEKTTLLNLIRNTESIPSSITIPDIDSPDFILPPRLSEYPRVILDEGVLLPAFSPGSTLPQVTTIGAIIAKAIEEIEQALPGGDGSPGGGGQMVNIVREDDVSSGTDDTVYSSLRTLKEIQKSIQSLTTTLEGKYLSKIKYDTAFKLINFIEGINVGSYSPGLLGSGATIRDVNGISIAEVDQLKVRMRAEFFSVLIHNAKHIGGQYIISAADIVCNRVEETTNFYRCYFDRGENNEVLNLFSNQDRARCQVFSGSGQKFYWRKVVAVGPDYIELSKTDMASGDNDIPAVGDHIFQLGSDDPERQGAMILSSVGPDSPSFKQYAGIDGFSLSDKVTTAFTSKGNQISGRTVFKSDGTNYEDWADGIEGDIQESQSAANAADAKAQQAIADAAANVSDYNAKFATLQNQVDGQVNNWFYPYVPTLANYPASDWTTNEIRDRHIGDTFTNTQAFVDNATTPNAGKSWRYVKNESTYSWTLIADSDAVKALLQASQAQATADGKSTTFLVQPSNYHLGDTWVLNSDRTVNGTAYKQGEILTATQDSVTFNEAHWMKRVRYAGQAEINEAVVKATYWSIKASSPVIYKDAINASTSGTHTPVTVSGELRSGTTTTAGGFITVTPNGGTEGTATESPVTITPANGDGKTSYTVKLYDTASKTTLLDTMTIPVVFKGASGVNAINAVLSNEADVLPASSEGVVSDYSGSGTTIRVFEGATELTYGTGNGQYQVSASGSGITVGSASTSGNRRVYGVASNMTSDNATITFTITGKTASGASFSLTKDQAFAKSRTGAKGDAGVSITEVDVEFAKNTNPTTAPTTGWTTTAPSLSGNEQLWTRTKTAYSSGNPTYSTPANITPKKGDTGAVGQGVESVTEEFAISTSKTTQPTSGWSPTQPTWIQGQYIWSRVKVVYKNPTDTVYTGYAVSSEWEAVNELQIGGRNLVLNSLNRIGISTNDFSTLPIQDQAVSGENYRRFRRTYPEGVTGTDISTYTSEFFTPEKSGYYTYSTYFRPNEFDIELRLRFNGYGDYTLCKANEWTQISVTDWIEAGVATRLFGVYGVMPPEAVQWIDYNRVSVTIGNKPTDWTPAPEDVQAEINTAKQEALSAAGNAQTTANSLKDFTDTAFRDGIIDRSESVAIEKYKNSLNEAMSKAQASYMKVFLNTYLEGAAKTDLEDAKINLWGQRDTLLSAINTAISGGTTTPAQKTSVDNAFNTFNNLMAAFQNALEEANKAIQAKLDALSTEKVENLQIGGTNLIPLTPSLWERGTFSTSVPGSGEQVSTTRLRTKNYYPVLPDTEYVINRHSAIGRALIVLFDANGDRIINRGWFTEEAIIVTDSNAVSFRAVIGKDDDSAITLDELPDYKFKFEKGNKATDWSPSPEDVDAAIDGIEIGWRNLLVGSKDYSMSNPIFEGSTGTDTGMDENFWVITMGTAYLQVNIPSKIAVGERFTFSFIHTRRTSSAQDFQITYGSSTKQFNSNSDVQKLVFTAVKTSDSYLRISRVGGGSGWTLRVDEFQIEKGNKATDWTPAPVDVQAEANKSKAITDKFRTTIDGGLISTVMMMLREHNSEQNTAGISGLQGALRDQPSYWSGGTHEQAQAFVPFIKKIENDQATTLSEYQNLPRVVFLHNGAGKLGDFIVDSTGRILMIDPDTGQIRLIFGTNTIPSAADLIAGLSPSGSATINGSSTSTNQVLAGSTNVTKSGASGTFNSTSLQVAASGRRQANGQPSAVYAAIWLRVGGVRKQAIATVSATFDNTPDYISKDVSIQTGDIRSVLHQTGVYTFELVVSKVGDIHYENASVNGTTFTWKYTTAGVKRFEFGLDGFMSWFSNHGIHFSENEGFYVKGAIDAPGAGLGGGKSASTGAVSSRWGRVTGGNRSANTTTIYHNIGDSNYTITVSPQSSVSWHFQSKTANSIQVVCSANFDFVLVRTPS